MDYNKIKNMLNTEGNEPLPSNLDWDSVEMGIMDVMQSLDDTPSSVKEQKSDRWKIIIILFLFLGSLLGLLCLYQRVQTLEDALVDIDKKHLAKGVSTNVDQYTTPTPVNRSTDDKNEKGSGDNNTNNTNADNRNADNNTYNINNNTNADVVGNNEVDYSNRSSEFQKLMEATSRAEAITAYTRNKLGIKPTFNQHDGSVDKLARNNSSSSLSLSSSLVLEESRINSEGSESLIVPALPMISLMPFTLDQPSFNLMFDVNSVNQLTQSKEKFTESYDRLIWESGLLYWNEGYGNIKPEREPYESTLPSFQLGIGYVKELKKSYFTQIGLQYQQLESKLEYMTTLEDYTTVNLIDTIIQVQNDLLSGEQTIIKGDVAVPVDAQRRVVHHNTIKVLKVSAAIGKTWRYRSIAADAYIGIGMARRISSTGRTLLNDTIIDFDGTTNDFLNNQFIVDGNIGLRLQYSLSPRIGIISGLQIQKSLTNWSKEIGVAMRPAMMSFQLGLGYSIL